MTQEQTKKIMAMIKANYPIYHSKSDSTTLVAAVKMMTILLEDIDYNIVNLALLKYMSQPHEFPPNPGQLRSICEELLSPFTVTMDWFGNPICDENLPIIHNTLVKRYEEECKMLKGSKN